VVKVTVHRPDAFVRNDAVVHNKLAQITKRPDGCLNCYVVKFMDNAGINLFVLIVAERVFYRTRSTMRATMAAM
jgi:hypothetical protein